LVADETGFGMSGKLGVNREAMAVIDCGAAEQEPSGTGRERTGTP